MRSRWRQCGGRARASRMTASESWARGLCARRPWAGGSEPAWPPRPGCRLPLARRRRCRARSRRRVRRRALPRRAYPSSDQRPAFTDVPGISWRWPGSAVSESVSRAKAQFDPLDPDCPAAVGFDVRGAEADVAGSRLEAVGQSRKHAFDDLLRAAADDPGVGARHPDIRLKGSALRQEALIRGGNVRMGAEDGADASIEVPAHGLLFAGGFRMHIHDDGT